MTKPRMPPQEIIRAQAYRCLKKLGHNAVYSISDLIGEGQLCLDRARKHWRRDGEASFSTYLTVVLFDHYGRILDHVIREGRHTDLTVEPKAHQSAVFVDRETGKLRFQFRHSPVSRQAEEFLRIVFAPPPELVTMLHNSGRKTMASIVGEFLGWSRPKLKTVERELWEAIIA